MWLKDVLGFNVFPLFGFFVYSVDTTWLETDVCLEYACVSSNDNGGDINITIYWFLFFIKFYLILNKLWTLLRKFEYQLEVAMHQNRLFKVDTQALELSHSKLTY